MILELFLSKPFVCNTIEKFTLQNPGFLNFRSGVGYQCTGDMSEWTKCQYKTVLPKRKAFKVPGAFKETYNFLNIYNCKIGARIIPNNPSTVKAAQVWFRNFFIHERTR